MNLEISTKSLIDFEDSLDGASEYILDAIKKELVITGLMVESAYKVAVPVDTGRLRASAWTKHEGLKSFSYTAQGKSYNGDLDFDPKDGGVGVGTNVEYANAIEYGFSGTVAIPSHQRTITMAFGRRIVPTTFTVAGHSRKMDIKANGAMAKAFDKETQGLEKRIANLLK